MASGLGTGDYKKIASSIWNLTDILRGDFKHTDMARIIIPFLLLRRMECVLELTKEKVGTPSRGIRSTLEEHIRRFPDDIKVLFEEFSFQNTIKDLERANLLDTVASHFAKLDLRPDVFSNRDLSNIYEDVIRRYATSLNEKAGEFMTPRDVVRLTTRLVIHPDKEIFAEKGVVKSIYDPACGLLGFISDALDQIGEMKSQAQIIPYGQEMDPKTHAMAVSSMLIKGCDGSTVAQGSTLSDDKFVDRRFHYCLANPPFGIKWEKDRAAVEREHKELGYRGRFGPGLPRVSDGSMLFLMHLVSKMETPENGGGRVGIVLSGSPLFTGDAGSGESEIRRWLLESDLVEAIIALPTDMFFNTGIATYVWILSNKKEGHRKEKVQLIDLREIWTPMPKSEGTKRRYLTDEQIDDVVRAYDAYRETDISKILATSDFAYRKVVIKKKLRGKLQVSGDTINEVKKGRHFLKLTDDQQDAWVNLLEQHKGRHVYGWVERLASSFKRDSIYGKNGKPLLREITAALFVSDPRGEIILDDKGSPLSDPDFRDT